MHVQVVPSALKRRYFVSVLYLNTSRARQVFKQNLGSANHLIITTLVGLDAVEAGVVTTAPPGLHAVWSPRNPATSARRSRRLILDMALVRAVDSLDLYFLESQRKPKLVQNVDLRCALDNARRSVMNKFYAFQKQYKNLDPVLCAMINLMIAWRNRAAHSDSDDEISVDNLQILRANPISLQTKFQGLNFVQLQKGYDNYGSPTFKEVTSFINAVHQFVSALEEEQFKALDQKTFLREVLATALSDRNSLDATAAKTKHKAATSIWGKDKESRKKSIMRLFHHNGLSSEITNSNSYSIAFDDKHFNDISEMNPKSIIEWIDARN